MDAAFLWGFDRVGDLYQLSCGGFRIGERAVGGEFH
jgi:hypothetical protein